MPTTLVIGALISVVLPLIPGSTTYYQAPKPTYQIVYAQVTAYTSSEDETDDTPTLTASGSTTSSTTVACPAKLAFGTRVEIMERVYRCEDRMNKRYRDTEHYDIWMADKELAYKWGRKDIAIKVYDN